MDDLVIKVEGISKTFKLPHEKNTSIKSLVINFWRRNKGYEIQKALEGISFEVQKGEFFCIAGRNGSGKSTLLKLLAGIYMPTKGSIQVNGKLIPFIELGVGFNPELTGRENVFLNGALLGFSRKEVFKMYDSIVDFAEIGRFMDQKLKNYSSGMQVRLAFSIAIQAQGDILVLDEVLAVGDEAFQQKCVSVFEKYKANKQTIVLVTHDMSVVEKFGTRALLIKDGELVKIGTPRLIAQMYREENSDAYATEQQKKEDRKFINNNFKVLILDPRTKQTKKRFKQGQTAIVKLSWNKPGVQNVGVAIMKQSGEYIFGPNTAQDKFRLSKDTREVYYEVKLDLGVGEYYLKAGLFGEKPSHVIEFIDEGPSLVVEKTSGPSWGGVTYLDHAWNNLK